MMTGEIRLNPCKPLPMHNISQINLMYIMSITNTKSKLILSESVAGSAPEKYTAPLA